jgi:ABC-type transport system involved in multi-copper enzyme maturation permease subunit
MTVLVIAHNTAREVIRNKVLTIIFFAFLMVGVSAVFGAASIGDGRSSSGLQPAQHFSLRRHHHGDPGRNLLSKGGSARRPSSTFFKPVARWQFIVGKYLGLLWTLTLLVAVMSGR